MVAPDPDDPAEREEHIRTVLASIPDYYCGGAKPPPTRRPDFPLILPPVSEMTLDEIAALQLGDCMNEVDYIRTPMYVRHHLSYTRLQRSTYREVVRYAWERLKGQEKAIDEAEALLDKLKLVGSERGYGRKGEAYLERAEHVGDEEWLAHASSPEMKRETQLAANERSEMEMSENTMLRDAEATMEGNCIWGNGPFDSDAPRPNMWRPYCPIREAKREAMMAKNRRGRGNGRGGAHNANANYNRNNNNNPRNNTARNYTGNSRMDGSWRRIDDVTSQMEKVKISGTIDDPFVDDVVTPKADCSTMGTLDDAFTDNDPVTPTPKGYGNRGAPRAYGNPVTPKNNGGRGSWWDS